MNKVLTLSQKQRDSTFKRILKKIINLFDFIPKVRSKSLLSVNNRLVHTLIGFTLMIIFQMIPYFGLYYISRETFISIFTSRSKTMVALPKNSALLAPLTFTMMTKFFKLKFTTERQKESFSRGLRNISVLVGVLFRYNYLLLFRELGNVFVMLFTLNYLTLVVVVYTLQNLVSCVCVIWIEEYLESFGINNKFNFAYYQAAEVILQVYTSPVPGNLGFHTLFMIIFVIGFLNVEDTVFSKEIKIRHAMVSSISQSIKLKLPNMIASNIFAYKILKTAFYNLLDLVINPALDLYCFLAQTEVKRIPQWFLDSPFFNEHYITILYFPTWRCSYIYNSLFAIFLDYFLFLPLLTIFMEFHNLEYDSNLLLTQIKDNRYNVVTTQSPGIYIKNLVNQVKRYAIFIGYPFHLVSVMIPIYGIVLTAGTLVYFYGRLQNIIDSIKTTKVIDLPPFLRTFKNLI